jgi:predicted nucleic acid-binding protein
MMKHYADSSFLVSCYLADRNSAAAKAWLASSAVQLPFTELHALEVRNAFQLGVFRQAVTPADAANAVADVQSDLRNGRLIRMPVDWPTVWRMAAALSGRHSAIIGVRSLDILHVAVAKSLRAGELVSFDARQRSLAAIVGLSTSP